MNKNFIIPADVPPSAHTEFINNYTALLKGSQRIFLMAGDHKMEHLDADFSGPTVDKTAHKPEHLFEIAQKAPIGAFATQLGLIARYGMQYPDINYIAKLNSKTNLIPASERDPLSKQLWTLDDVLALKTQSDLRIRGIGLTIYLGSEFENSMLAQASQAIFQAHQQGLLALIWMYPRSKYIKNEREPHLLAGAAGVAHCLGADIVKLHPPLTEDGNTDGQEFIIQAAGNTKVIFAGGAERNKNDLLKDVQEQVSKGSFGVAIGRNIFSHALESAVEIAEQIAELLG